MRCEWIVMRSEEAIAFWLKPARAEREFFAGVIAELAARFDAPIFEPHVTLWGGRIRKEHGLQILHECDLQAPLEMEVDRVRSSEKFTKTLFVQFHASALAAELSDALTTAAQAESDSAFDPHLSLLYKEMPEAEKRALQTAIAIPFERVTFDGVQLITTPVPITSRAEVEAWRTIGERTITTGET